MVHLSHYFSYAITDELDFAQALYTFLLCASYCPCISGLKFSIIDNTGKYLFLRKCLVTLYNDEKPIIFILFMSGLNMSI